jgi:hypothetical protein
MSSPLPDPVPPVAVLVVRAWRESSDRDAFRARIFSSVRLTGEPLQARSVSSVEELEEVVTRWLRQLRAT